MYILDTIYDDYDITYQSKINENIIPIMILLGILCVLIVIYFIAMMRINKKANRSGISAIIPIYNCVVLMEVINESKWKMLLLLIPGVNIIYFCMSMYKLAKFFRKDDVFCILAAVFPLIVIPILGFGDSEYAGINEEARKGVSVAKELPVETKKKPTLSNPDQPMKERTKVNMSIGGGVYQKDYRDSLLEAKNIKEVKKPDVADFRIETTENQVTPSQQSGTDLFQNVTFVETPEPQNQENIEAISHSTVEVSEQSNEVPNLLQNNDVIPTPIPAVQINEHGITPDSQTTSSEVLPPILGIPQLQQPEIKKAPPVDLLAPQQQSAPPSGAQPITGNPALQGLNNVQATKTKEEFINCPNCGAKVKSTASKCFMCGKPL